MSIAEQNQARRVLISGCLIIFALGITNGFYLEPLRDASVALFWVQDVIHFVVAPVIILIYAYKRFRISPADYCLISASRTYPLYELVGASVLVSVIFGLVLLPFDKVLYHVLNTYGLVDTGLKYASAVPEGYLRLPVVLYLAITAGVVEEIFYRGIPYKLINESKSLVRKKFIYVVGTSIAFSAIHWDKGLHLLVGTFVFGLVASYLYLKLKNLWPLIGGHFIYDFYVFW